MSSSQSMAHDEAMHRYEEQYDALKAKLQAVGFIGRGSVQTRRIACGSPTCRCHHDPDARHGPYHYWTRKARGKTVGLKLTEDELVVCPRNDLAVARVWPNGSSNADFGPNRRNASKIKRQLVQGTHH